MQVTRIYESPRVTKPYTDEQWAAVMALGAEVDEELASGDVRLTMGGEPTFVAVDDRDAAEWNTDALGPTKRGLATALVHKLRAEYGQGGFLHFGQGKWYPGEQLPRWALGIYWREDGQPCWRNPALFADERDPSHYSSEDARRFTHLLADKLGVTGKYIQAGYEDVWYYLWRERRLPVNVDPFDSKLDDEMERSRLRRVFEQKLDAVIGYVLPLQARRGRRRGQWLALAHRPLVPARRAHVPDARRFAHGLPAAAGLAALGQQVGLPLPDRAGPLRRAHGSAARRHACAPSTTRCRTARPTTPPTPRAAALPKAAWSRCKARVTARAAPPVA